MRERWFPGTLVIVCGPITYIDKTGLKTRYIETNHVLKAHYDVADDVNEAEIILPETSDQDSSLDNSLMIVFHKPLWIRQLRLCHSRKFKHSTYFKDISGN